MKYLTTAILGTLAVMSCSDGSTGPKGSSTGSGGGVSGTGGIQGTGGGGATSGAGGSGLSGTGGSGNNLGGGGSSSAGGENTGGINSSGGGGGAGDSNATGTGGRPVTAEGGAGATGAGGSVAMPEAGVPNDGLKHGTFKMLVMSTTLEFAHDSIPTCLTMLRALGQTTDADLARIGAPAGSQWTVDVMGTNPAAVGYFSEITAANLQNYEMVYSDNPTGPVFTNAPDGANKKTIFQTYFNGGGSWAGQHSATDFENNSRWPWFQDNVNGGWFVTHDPDLTPGTVVWESAFTTHPILRGLASPWNTNDEWYVMNRNIEGVPGFQILAKVTVPNSALGTAPRPAIWIKENPAGGRAFYTIRGHNQRVYAEQEFRDLMLRGILWAVHRLK